MPEDSMRPDEYETVQKFHEAELTALADKLRDIEQKLLMLQEAERDLRQQLKDMLAYMELFKATIPGIAIPLNSEQAKQYKDVFKRLYAASF